MKKAIALFTLISASTSFGEFVAASRAKAFLQKNRVCDFSVGYYLVEKGEHPTDPSIRGKVYCVTDTVENARTIRERSGCAFLQYDLDTGRLEKPSVDIISGYLIPTAIAEGTPCASGGFEKLLETKMGFQGKPKVKKLLSQGPKIGMPFKTIVLYSNGKDFDSIFQRSIAGTIDEPKKGKK